MASRILRMVIAALPLLISSPADAARAAALDTLERQQREQPGLGMAEENAPNRAGYELLRRGQARDAASVLQFVTLAYPQSANAFDSLLDAQLSVPDAGGALATARRLLELLTTANELPDPVRRQMRERAQGVVQRRGRPTE